jgi:hypothetical protein
MPAKLKVKLRRKSPVKSLGPEWDSWNLQAHYDKHGHGVALVLKKGGSALGKWNYELQSKQTVNRARLWFEADHWEGNGQKDPRRSYFVDFRALWAVTDPEAEKFVSYYPMTMDGACTPAELAEKPPGERMMEFDIWLERKQAALSYRKVKIRYDARS